MKKQLPSVSYAHSNGRLPAPTLTSPNGEVSRLMAAAVVDRQFRELLLADPVTAIASGYGGESFHLTAQESDLILSVRQASSLAEFAMELTRNYSKAKEAEANQPVMSGALV